ALTHGADAPIKVRASLDGAALELSVENQGDVIPPDVLARLFEPFYRGPTESRNEGLGLGLYIASEIARAHGGTLTATSTPKATRFVLRIPA
ncbi:MAG TPA: sensor histidine kinase, partial [Hyphomicrobiaceae bacterium]